MIGNIFIGKHEIFFFFWNVFIMLASSQKTKIYHYWYPWRNQSGTELLCRLLWNTLRVKYPKNMCTHFKARQLETNTLCNFNFSTMTLPSTATASWEWGQRKIPHASRVAPRIPTPNIPRLFTREPRQKFFLLRTSVGASDALHVREHLSAIYFIKYRC